MASPSTELRKRRGEYGFDGCSTGGLAGAIIGWLGLAALTSVAAGSGRRLAAALGLCLTFVPVAIVPFYVHATRRGKFLVWAELLEQLQLRGDERVLDMGCGRGAVMTMVAKLLLRGRAIGLDLWTTDQTGNKPAATQRNLTAEGVDQCCTLLTGNMLAMPFQDSSFDLVVSSLAIHNIDQFRGPSQQRLRAIDEAARVLVPGGRLMIVDLMWTPAYAERLRELGMQQVQQRALDWHFWYGPWMGAGVVTATKPRSA